jgi:hypothetical protein
MIDIGGELSAALVPVLSELRELRAEVAALRGPEWVTVEQAASVLCCTPATIRSRCRGGDLQSRRCGRKILIAADSLRGHTVAEVDAAAREARS